MNSLKRKLPDYTNSGIAARIDDHIHDELDRRILRYKLIDNKTIEEIAELVDLPSSTARDRYYTGLNILFPRK